MKYLRMILQFLLPIFAVGQNAIDVVNDAELIRHINNVQDSWVAHESPRFRNHNIENVKHMCGFIENDDDRVDYFEDFDLHADIEVIPDSFDARDHWSECGSISTIRDQSNCGSCWAFASTESFNDRLCIASNGEFQTLLSPQDTLSCCGFLYGSMGCNGGQPSGAWKFFKNVGVVSGGEYGDTTTCMPYTYAPVKQDLVNMAIEKKCFTDVLELVKDAQKLIVDYSSNNYADLLKEVIATAGDIVNAIKDCSSGNLQSDCLTDLQNILENLNDIVNTNDPDTILDDITDIYTNITSLATDCIHSFKMTKDYSVQGSDKCVKSCSNTDYDISYKQDKHKSLSSYSLSSVTNIQKDLMTNGPLSMAFTVYADFPTYKSGVYHHVTGQQLGGHAVKLIGWGTSDKGEDYWIINNSWGNSWGENGSFRIRRGVDECNVESMSVDAGLVSYQ